MIAPAIKGWCPGALTPMPTGDGLLARVRVSAGRLSLEQAGGISECAAACGNGAIELTSRGNLQLRGVDEGALPELWARLSRLGLIDEDPAVERARNIVASPLGDIDPEAACDPAPLVCALEARISGDATLRALPAKFGFVIDVSGRWPLGDIDADVRFEAAGSGFVATLAEPRSRHPRPLPARGGEGSTTPLPASCGEGPGVGSALGLALSRGDLPEIASRLAGAFLALAGAGPDAPRRMRALVRRDGAAAVFAAAGLAPDIAIVPARVAAPSDVVGPLAFPKQTALGAALPFGRVDARGFAGLVGAARRRGATGLRLTPWRALVAVNLDASGATRLAEDLARLNFIVAPDDSRLGIVACPGAPACGHANSAAPADASVLANMLANGRGVALHVSGCAKGCARGVAAPLTLTATPGGYDLILNGRAGDPPVRRGLALRDAAALVASLSRELAA
jgi:precorrin-3B synthase